MSTTATADSKATFKQLGDCDDCGQPAFADRHVDGIELRKGADGEWHSKAQWRRVLMCPYHQGHYMQYMEERRKELAKKYGRKER